MTRQKQIAKQLDTAAAYARLAGKYEATSKQVWYLAGLFAKAEENNENLGYSHTEINELTKRHASFLIENITRPLVAA